MTAIDLPPLPPDAQVVMLFDASQPASAKRFTVVSLDGPVPEIVMRTTVAHGVGSDPDNDGMVERFSNEPNSLATSLGQYKVAEPYFSDKWQSTAYRLDGLDPTNSNARARAVVLHPSRYVRGDYAGRSWGCPALSFEDFEVLRAKVGLTNAYLVIHRSGTAEGWLHFNLENPICLTPSTATSMPQPQETWPPSVTPIQQSRAETLRPMAETMKATTRSIWPHEVATPMWCGGSSTWGWTQWLRTTMG